MYATDTVDAPSQSGSATTYGSSLDQESPWTIATVGSDILLRAENIVQLAERFLESSGPNYSFADISIIDLATELRRSTKTVRILAFDNQLEAYSG